MSDSNRSMVYYSLELPQFRNINQPVIYLTMSGSNYNVGMSSKSLKHAKSWVYKSSNTRRN